MALERSLGAAPGQFAFDKFQNYNNDVNGSPDYIGNNSLNYQQRIDYTGQKDEPLRLRDNNYNNGMGFDQNRFDQSPINDYNRGMGGNNYYGSGGY